MAELVAGYRLDRYELLSPIASGGMASVWLARLRGKRGFEKLFAIKTIKTELTEDARFTEMFLDEARIASGIQHPNVTQILDLGEQDGILYIVMEWVDGDSLAKIRRLAKKAGTPVRLDITLRIMADACAGLHAAHELRDRNGKNLGVVHRDVSPHNILVATSGAVKVIDFGIAKARDRQAGETGTGIVKGKIRYMAPEQAQGHAVDRRADIWAIGVCLHEMVTGVIPFDGDSDLDVMRRLMSDEPAPRADGAMPDAVREILSHSLVRDPEERFSSAAAMERALEIAMDALGVPATNEDVAEFLRTTLPELDAARTEQVGKALSASEARGEQMSMPAIGDDIALAATLVSDRRPATGAPASADAKTAIVSTSGGTKTTKKGQTSTKNQTGVKATAPKKKKPRPAGEGLSATPPSSDDSKITPTLAALTGSHATPKRGSNAAWYLLLLAAAGAGAWFVWPGASRLRAMVGAEVPPEPTPAATVDAVPGPEPTVVTTTAPSAAPVATAQPSAAASASAGPTIPAASASAVATSSAAVVPPLAGRPPVAVPRPTAPEPPPPAQPWPAPPPAEEPPDDKPYD